MEASKFLPEVIDIAKKAGAFIRNESLKFTIEQAEYKGLNDLVSYVDKESEKMIVSALQVIFPEAGFITEEGTITKNSDDFNWVIDPLDGTSNFIHGIPMYAVSIALMKGKKSLLGVVYEVNRDECFYALKGGGAYCNEKPISVSRALKLSESLIATGFPIFNFNNLRAYLKILKQLMKKCHGMRRMGSAAVDLCYVACGRADAYFEYNLNSWDIAAGTLIVQEAGGTVTDFSGGGNFIFGRELVSGSAVQNELLQLIQKNWTAPACPI
ncbi:MAG: inositol monophosphatase family protein [Bacteroidetes bacterium]|nr:inositol monophosphatase family protein [Bacteroidota bacterium]MDA1121466.1 inositol monophosphatase family protein [Bacteroidota bacterium]